MTFFHKRAGWLSSFRRSDLKLIICRCEDVTEREIVDAVERGYDDLESLKRYLGFGTGPCQGKNCIAKVASILVSRKKQVVSPITSRIPVFALPLGMFAKARDKNER